MLLGGRKVLLDSRKVLLGCRKVLLDSRKVLLGGRKVLLDSRKVLLGGRKVLVLLGGTQPVIPPNLNNIAWGPQVRKVQPI